MVLLPSYSKVTAMVASLSQTITNGESLLGTEMAPQYPPFMTFDNPTPDGFPWGARTAGQSNPYKDVPETGMTRYYNFTISKMTLAPDGYGSFLSAYFLSMCSSSDDRRQPRVSWANH